MLTKSMRAATLARPGDCYLISCPGYWGKGKTVAEAIKNLPYGFDERWILYSVHRKSYIDGDGYICRPAEAKDCPEIEIGRSDKLKPKSKAA